MIQRVLRQVTALVIGTALIGGTGVGAAVASEDLVMLSPDSDESGPAAPLYSWVAEPEIENARARAQSASPAVTWGACGVFDKNLKIVRAFKGRSQAHIGGRSITYGGSNLTCGSGTWGYRHIVKRHLGEWEARAAVAQENWRDTADYGIHWALRDPDKITYRAANDTFCYSRKILLIDDRTNEVVGSYFPKVSVARVSHRIITAYPSGSQC